MVQTTKRTCAVLVLGMALGAAGASAYVRFVPSSAAQTPQRRPGNLENERVALGAGDDRAADAKAPTGRKPNIVFMLTDNLGYGEPGCYGGGILRGAPTPRIDRLAREGLRLLNYNVEAQCTPSRSALQTGRFSIRSGTMRVNRGGALYGLTQWEITLAELLSRQGYATAHFGKWHLGSTEG